MPVHLADGVFWQQCLVISAAFILAYSWVPIYIWYKTGQLGEDARRIVCVYTLVMCATLIVCVYSGEMAPALDIEAARLACVTLALVALIVYLMRLLIREKRHRTTLYIGAIGVLASVSCGTALSCLLVLAST